MHETDAWQQSEHVLDYLTDIRPALPLYKEQVQLIPEIVKASGVEVAKFLDIGTGDGEIAFTVLEANPGSSAVMVDFSDSMLEAAKKRALEYPDQTEILKRDISDSGWLEGVDGSAQFDLVVSGLCIHHLTDARKKQVYAEIYDLLRPGGLFLNVDHVAAASQWQDDLFDKLIVDAVYEYQRERAGSESRSRAEVEAICHNDDDKPVSPVLQCQWLEEVGFKQVDIFFKWLGVAIFGGIKSDKA